LPRPLIALVDRALSIEPARRPSAERLGAALRATGHRHERRTHTLPQVSPPSPGRFAAAAAAGLFAGASAAALPFYPAGWPLGIAALAAGSTLFRERAGLALALAIPVLPLGNLSAGLAWAYAALALGWLVLSWKDSRTGLFFLCGPLLAPLSLLGLLPLAAHRLRGGVARAVHVFAAVLVAGLVAGLRGGKLPFTGSFAPALELDSTRSPFTAASTIWDALSARPTLLFEAIVLAVAAAALPHIRRHRIAPFGIALLAGILAPGPALPNAAIVVTILVTCLGMALKGES
jgi:hypothetical protein